MNLKNITAQLARASDWSKATGNNCCNISKGIYRNSVL